MRKYEINIDKKKGNIGGQLTEILRWKIITGEYLPGTILPSLSELGSQLGVSHNTIQIAFKNLRDLGLVKFRPTVGCVVRDDMPCKTASILPADYDFSLEILGGLNEVLNGHGQTDLRLYSNTAEFHACLELVCLENYSGAVIYPEHSATDKIRQLRNSGFPVIVIDNFLKDASQGSYVDSGLYEAGLLLSETLIKKRDIPLAVVTPDSPDGWKFQDGYREAHRKCREFVWTGHVKRLMPGIDAAEATRTLLSSSRPSKSIIFARPADAVAGAFVLKESGRENIRIATFGNVPGMELWSHPIITAKRNMWEVGTDSGKMLQELRQLPRQERLNLRTVMHHPALFR